MARTPDRGAVMAGPKDELPPPRLAQELQASADALEQVLNRCAELHGEFMRQGERHRGGGRIEEVLSDELRHRRIRMTLHAAGGLPDLIRGDAGQALARFPDVDVSGARLPSLPSTTEPFDVALWWDRLGHDEQHLVMQQLGHWCGRADGLPAEVRHAVNTAYLGEEIHARTGTLGEDRQPRPTPTDGVDDPSVVVAHEADEREVRDLRGLLKIRALFADPSEVDDVPEGLVPAEDFAALDEVTTPLEERSLYLLDAREYPLKTAVVLGDLATAHTVVVHVPGTTTTVDLRLYREGTWMSALRDEAGRIIGEDEGGRSGIAIVDWIGYQAPYDVAARRALGASGIRWVVPGEAIDDRYARAAAPSLVKFAVGLRTILGPGVRMVASGHSYGASVLGLALRETDVFDTCMIAGCPGIFTDDISVLRLPEGQFYAAVGTGDLIARLGVFGPDVTKLRGVRLVAPVPHQATYPDGGKAWTRLNVGHESYFDRGSSLLHDLATIVVGRDVPTRWPSWAT